MLLGRAASTRLHRSCPLLAAARGATRIRTSTTGFATAGATGGMVDVMVKVIAVITAAIPSPTALRQVGRNHCVGGSGEAVGPVHT
ncbi:MAG: hypothetical protein M3N02_09015, partial [Pseudomonadota bacterium]|nr:hypothetical protein [Pseudomonadota bacterium]